MPTILFFGTEEFAESMLQQLLDSQQFSVIGVVTKPDQIIGRKKEIYKSPVKILAEQNGLPVYQPETLKNFDIAIQKWDLSVVCQYGKIIPKAMIDLPEYGTINVHTSLLPKYRGASPIQTALINGEIETGITIMLMDEKMDHGPILSQEKISISPNDTYPILSKKMMPVAGRLLISTLNQWITQQIKPQAQDEAMATSCKLLERENGKVNWQEMTAEQIYNLYRGTFPWPGIWTFLHEKRLKLTSIRLTDEFISPGHVVQEQGKIVVGTKQGSIELVKVQLEGKNEMEIKNFINGYKLINLTLE